MILAGIVCVGFAGLDEYHQSFVDSRTPSVKDVGIDSIGAMIRCSVGTGILLVRTEQPGKEKEEKTKIKNCGTFYITVRGCKRYRSFLVQEIAAVSNAGISGSAVQILRGHGGGKYL